MKTKIVFILVFLFIIVLGLSIKYSQYTRIKSDEMLETYRSVENMIAEYYYKYWDVPDKEDLITFVENREDKEESKKVGDCLNYPGLTIIADSLDNYVLIKLFSDNKNVFNKNTLLLKDLNFFDFLIKKEILVSQQPVDDLCSYFEYRFFVDKEPYENDALKKKIHSLLVKLFRDEKRVDMKTAERCMFKCTVTDSINVNVSLVCGKIDADFPLNELQRSIKDILAEDNMWICNRKLNG